jgi:hypothetical protein
MKLHELKAKGSITEAEYSKLHCKLNLPRTLNLIATGMNQAGRPTCENERDATWRAS